MKLIILTIAICLLPMGAYSKTYYRPNRNQYKDYQQTNPQYQKDRENLRRYMGIEMDYGKRRQMEKWEKNRGRKK